MAKMNELGVIVEKALDYFWVVSVALFIWIRNVSLKIEKVEMRLDESKTDREKIHSVVDKVSEQIGDIHISQTRLHTLLESHITQENQLSGMVTKILANKRED
jgi:hypothetical protein